MKADIELTIDQMELYGFEKTDMLHIKSAVEKELLVLLSKNELLETFTSSESIRGIEGQSFDFSPNAAPEVIGAQIAQSIFHSLTSKN